MEGKSFTRIRSLVNDVLVKQPLPKNTAFLFATFVALSSLAMGSYVLLAPSSKKLTAQSVPLPSPTPIIQPSPVPTEPAMTPTTAAKKLTPTPTAIPIPTPTTNPTQGWTTYSNYYYGYSIKYPPTWTVRDLGLLEPKVPSYVVFNPNTATSSARSITISASSRTFEEQVIINGASPSAIMVAGVLGSLQNMQDSDGGKSVAVTVPRAGTILILRGKTPFPTTFNQMLQTLRIN